MVCYDWLVNSCMLLRVISIVDFLWFIIFSGSGSCLKRFYSIRMVMKVVVMVRLMVIIWCVCCVNLMIVGMVCSLFCMVILFVVCRVRLVLVFMVIVVWVVVMVGVLLMLLLMSSIWWLLVCRLCMILIFCLGSNVVCILVILVFWVIC